MSELKDTAAIRDFMVACDDVVRDAPGVPSDDERLLRAKLIMEEALEVMEALGVAVTTPGRDLVERADLDYSITKKAEDVDLIEVASELADLNYVNKGTAHTCGVPVDRVFDEIHLANMRKVGADGKVIRRADGKILKPEGWQKADISAVMGKRSA